MKKRNLFSERVLELVLSIPKGRVTTYGRLARAAGGGTMAAQSITAILWKAEQRGVSAGGGSASGGKNIPYHRIVYADGRIWVNPEHREERLKLYKKEGIGIENDKVVNFKKIVL